MLIQPGKFDHPSPDNPVIEIQGQITLLWLFRRIYGRKKREPPLAGNARAISNILQGAG